MPNKTYKKIMSGLLDNNIMFSDMVFVLESKSFTHRIKGDHHIFTRKDIAEIINVQPNGSQAKAYQVKQVRNIFKKYGI